MATKETKLVGHVQEVLRIKDERNEQEDKKIEHFQKFKFHLGRTQALTRQLNEKIEDFEEYRIKKTGGMVKNEKGKTNKKTK